ncbi:hypothetical protein [Erythrobacter alti]|uniref:hypothetical protein n=1 Tax=Erythrobacter alti TaxID=1896145 RepID=UPI0030F4912E
MTKRDIAQFFRAVGGGTLGGSLFFIWLSIPTGAAMMLQDYLIEGLWLALAPVAITGMVTLLASLVFGLPLTVYLCATDSECRRTYAVAGLLLGALIPLVVFFEHIAVGAILAVPGMVAGVLTGSIWGDYRHAQANPETSFAPPEEHADEARPNSIHELLY